MFIFQFGKIEIKISVICVFAGNFLKTLIYQCPETVIDIVKFDEKC